MNRKTPQILSSGLIFSGIVTAGILLAGCQPTPLDLNKQSATDVPQEEGAISALNMTYSPDTLTVRPGATILFTNRDVADHSITSDDGNSFDTGLIAQDGIGEFTAPTIPGTYPYHCTSHPTMRGTLIVE